MSLQVEEVLQRLKGRGHRLTPQRQRIIEVLLEGDEPQTAQEIYQRVREQYPNVSLDTVYRNLGLLTDTGLVHQINLKAGERARFEFAGDARHHHHLVCLSCGQSICLDFCPMADAAAESARQHGFQVVGHAFELYGYCARCQKSEDTAD